MTCVSHHDACECRHAQNQQAWDNLIKDADQLRAERDTAVAGLKFYAEQEHMSGLEAFETASGEPQSYLCSPSEDCEVCSQTVVEDGSVARFVLAQLPRAGERARLVEDLVAEVGEMVHTQHNAFVVNHKIVSAYARLALFAALEEK
jgi:hypothetical protein